MSASTKVPEYTERSVPCEVRITLVAARRNQPAPLAVDSHGISRSVPPELWLNVFAGVLDEDVAVERGRLAAGVTDEEERHAILFDVMKKD